MTNREWISIYQRLPAAMASWLQPSFPTVSLCDVPLRIKHVREYGRTWDAVSDGLAIYLDTAWWESQPNTNEFFQLLAHEFTHVRQAREIGWIRYQARNVVTMLRSWRRGSLYDHSLSPDEREANQMRESVYERLAPYRPAWDGLLDKQHEG